MVMEVFPESKIGIIKRITLRVIRATERILRLGKRKGELNKVFHVRITAE